MATVKINRDTDPLDPRKEWDNVGTMACWHPNYTLGDEQPKCDPERWLEDNAPEGSVVLALYLYEHGGITMQCNPYTSPWDSGQVGVIVATPDKIQEEWKGDRAAAENYLRAEVETYDHYLTGAVYSYLIEDPQPCGECGQETGPELIDSCSGFYGDCLDDMKANVDEQYHAALTEAWNGEMV